VTSTSEAAKAEVAYIDPGKTLRQAGHLMRELGVAALHVRGEKGEAQGTISQEMLVRCIAEGGDPKTVTVGEVASAARGRRSAPARSPGGGNRRSHHGPDAGGAQLDWAELGPGPAWPWQGRGAPGSEMTVQTPGLVA
jgi:CBS domain-containing protein